MNLDNILTGEQNSSNAGLTKFMYWFKTCSKSRPLSFISLGTENNYMYLILKSLIKFLPLRASLVSESVSTNSFMWNKFLTSGK